MTREKELELAISDGLTLAISGQAAKNEGYEHALSDLKEMLNWQSVNKVHRGRQMYLGRMPGALDIN